MLRSLMTAVTGVRAHQTMLDVTGNNIANVNTVGFKKDFTIFSDLMYQNQKSPSGAGDTLGGIDPAQVGLGVNVAAIETIFTQGAASYTGNTSDMMIQGSGFFVYKSGEQNYFSRSGATIRDENSELVMSGSGYYLQGYEYETDPLDPTSRTLSSELSNISVPVGKKLEARATTEVKYQCNLNSESDAYLPYGFPDIPFNAYAGWPNSTGDETSGQGVVNIAGVDCNFSVKSLSNLTGTDAGDENGFSYLEITIADNINTDVIYFNITGIDSSTMLPQLQVVRATNNDAESQGEGGDDDWQVWLGPQDIAEPNRLNVSYDDSTGVLKLYRGSEVAFEFDIKSRMNYSYFSVSDPSANINNIPILAEFDESVVSRGDNSSLSETNTTLTMWYMNADGTMGRMTSEVYFNADGTFSTAEPIMGDNLPIAGTNLSGETMRLRGAEDTGVAGHSTYLIFEREANPATPSNFSSTESVGRIGMGGYHSTKTTIYDDNGKKHTLEVNFKKLTENRWRWEAFILDEQGNQTDIIPTPHAGEVEFSGAGYVSNVVSSEGNVSRHGRDYDGSNANIDIDVPFSLNGQGNSTITLNFSGDGDNMMGVTQYASDTTTKAVYQDGYTMGVMESYSIGVDGTITGSYTNGQNIALYRVALATFANEQGLEKVGENLFAQSVNSGTANIDPATVNGKGKIMSQNLEMSNVDLTEEFTHLIIAQRGFQANTRVITTSDQILEEVVNLKR